MKTLIAIADRGYLSIPKLPSQSWAKELFLIKYFDF